MLKINEDEIHPGQGSKQRESGDMPADYTKTVIAIEELMSNTD
jgi:hypothetical protein